MRHLRTLLLGLVVLGTLQAPLIGQPILAPKVPVTPPVPVAPPVPVNAKKYDGSKFVFAVDGGGKIGHIYHHLASLTDHERLPLRVINVRWSTSDLAIHDYKDQELQRIWARKMAEMAMQVRSESPKTEIYFVAHSAGARVALAAAEMMPPKSVDRIVLLAAAVRTNHDLRPALRTSRYGIDNFWSEDDNYLKYHVTKWGCADGSKGVAAGNYGFHVPEYRDMEGFAAYKNVRQYCWQETLRGQGTHLTWIKKPNLRAHVIPLFNRIEVQVQEPPTPPVKTPPSVKKA